MTRRDFIEKTTVTAAGVGLTSFTPAKGPIRLGINMEFVRHHDLSFAAGIKKAAEIGYEYIEPMVHFGRELLSEAGYFHSVSMFDDPLSVKELCDKHNLKLSGLSSHTPLCKP